MSDLITRLATDVRARSAARLGALDVQAQSAAQRAADALASGRHDDGVLLLVCALITTEQIDQLAQEGTS